MVLRLRGGGRLPWHPECRPAAEGWFHPGRPGTSDTTVLNEGPLRVTFESDRRQTGAGSRHGACIPTHADMTMSRADSLFWFLYEGVPGGEIDGARLHRPLRRARRSARWRAFESTSPERSGCTRPIRPTVGASSSLTTTRDGSVDSYRDLDGQMVVLGMGRGGSPAVPAPDACGGEPQTFSVGLVDSTAFEATADTIRSRYLPLDVLVGTGEYSGERARPRER